MNDEDAFLRAIEAAPDDLAPRLIFADWLEERNDPRGPWLRDPLIRPWMGLRVENPIQKLVDALPSESDIAEVLFRIGAPAIPALLIALRSPNADRRAQVQWVLRQFAEELQPFLPSLEADLKSDDANVREAAMLAIACMGEIGGAALAVLVARLRDPRVFEQLSALDALAQLGPSAASAVPAVLELWRREELAGSGTEIRRRAIVTIAQMAPASTEAIPVLAASLANPALQDDSLSALVGFGSLANDAMIGALERVDPQTASAIARLLTFAISQPAGFLPELFGSARLGNRGRRAMLNLCTELNPRDTRLLLPAIIAQLDRDDVAVQKAAADALGRLGPAASSALPALERINQGQSVELRRAVLKAMALVGPDSERTRTALRRGLIDRNKDIREAAWNAYFEMKGVPRAFRQFQKLMSNDEPEYRAAAAEGLGRLLSHAEEEDWYEVDDDDRPIEPEKAVGDEELDDAVEESVRLLIDALKDRSRAVRSAAATSLGEAIPDSESEFLTELQEALRDPVPAVREGAAYAIARLEDYDDDTVPALLRLTEDEEPEVESAAIYALGACRDDNPKVLRKLEAALRHKDKWMRAAAAWGFSEWEELPKFAERELPKLLKDPLENARLGALAMVAGATGWTDVQKVEAYRGGLRDELASVRNAAIEYLSSLRTPVRDRAVNEVVRMLETELDAERQAYIELVLSQCPSRGGALTRLLESPDERMRVRALRNLIGAGPSAAPAVPAMLAELNRESEATWMLAIESLRGIGPGAAAAFPRMLELLQSDGGQTRELVARVVGSLGPVAAPALDRLEALARDLDQNAQSAAFEALASMCAWTDRPMPLVSQGLRGDNMAAVMGVIAGIGNMGERALPLVPDVIARLDPNDPMLFSSIVAALGQLGPTAESAVPALASALRRVDEYDERVRIAEALGAIGKSASSAISPLERAAVEDESEDVRLAAVRALGVARSPAALTALRSLLFADDVMIRGAALRAMSEFGVNARDAIPDLCRALADTRWGRVRNDYDQRIDIFGVLELMKSVAEPAIPELRRALDEPDPHFGLRAVDVLQAIGSAALGALKTALKNDDAAVREAAKEAIESLRLAATR